MSATMDVDLFSEYFNKSPVLYLEGRQHPIQIYYTKQPQSDYLQAALVSIFQIHQVVSVSPISSLDEAKQTHRSSSASLLETQILFCRDDDFPHTVMQEAPSSHDILVFMTGQEEIEALARTCRDIAKHLPDGRGPMVVIPLYASLPPTQQLRVFLPAPKVQTCLNISHCCSQQNLLI